jgi:predicted tellurium resistance membrane protein TerC
VLGIDNIIFISIVSARLPLDQQPRARRLGLILVSIGVEF